MCLHKVLFWCISYVTVHIIKGPQRQKKDLWTCAPSEDSDQPAHSRSLIRIFTVRILDSQGWKVSSCGQRRLTRLRGCAGWFASPLGPHVRRYIFPRWSSKYKVGFHIRQSMRSSLIALTMKCNKEVLKQDAWTRNEVFNKSQSTVNIQTRSPMSCWSN